MTAREQLDAYIDELKRRLQLSALLLGAAIVASSALITTLVLVLITNAFAFSSASLWSARTVLFLILACGVVLGCVVPLLRLTRRRAATETEGAFPQFQQRLITIAERGSGGREPFAELLAKDTLVMARNADPRVVVPKKKLLVSLGVTIGALCVLLWMIVGGPGYLGYGAALLWTGDVGAAPLYDIHVTPGDAVVRRNADQLVTVQPRGIQVNGAHIYARYESATKWDQLAMQPQPGASGFQFLFAGIPENVEYYVEAGPLHSRRFKIRVTDVPTVKQILVTYHYPPWTGMGSVTEERGGDLRAIEGTEAHLEVTMDRPLDGGALVLDDNRQVSLSHGTGNTYEASLKMEKDGSYHIAGLDHDQSIRLSEDFFIEASKADPPDLVISKPAGDYRASPIEEVTVSVKADDPFGLNDLSLHYSVNGGAEQTVNLLKQKGEKTEDASTTLALENFKLVPGDIVSVYATAKDAHAESRTDMFFIQADPFEREFSQSQQMGGGGGGGAGNAPDEISQRQKEIIGSTWKQVGDKDSSAQRAAENAKFLSGVQSKLRDQAISLAGRLESRDLVQQNDEFTGFQSDMNAAAKAMGPASQKLQQQKWKDALPDEQKALQYLLRAEATFRQIQVAFGNAGGANGGGGSAGRDLASLFDLELDTQKNQYETAQTADSQSQRDQQIDEALRKLDELARREDQLASQNNARTPEQRWQQEMLRREAEQLQRQIEQLSRNNQGGSSQGQSSGQSSGSQSGQHGSASDPRIQQALNQLRQADEDMRRAGSQQSQADARRAAERLHEATNLLNRAQNQQQSGRLDALADEAERLANEEGKQSDRIRSMANGQMGRYGEEAGEGLSNDNTEHLAKDRQQLADDLSRLEKQMRDSVRDLSSNNRATASKLRDALRELDQSDLDTRLQRSADWLRRGVNPDRNGSESQIASQLQKLNQQVHDAQQQAQQAGGSGKNGDNSKNALDQVENLRNRLEALNRNFGAPGNSGNNNGQSRSGANNGGSGRYGGRDIVPAGPGGDVGPFVHRGGGAPDGGPIYGGMNTGNNDYGQLYSTPSRETAPPAVPPEQAYRESIQELEHLSQTLKDDPESLRQVEEMIREMQRLDPSRFPGNPEIVDQLHNQVLGQVDKLELQLRRNLDAKQAGQVRNSESLPTPAGYEDAVADYFRRLSKNP
jgi:hypothetical protein